jgi:hypothetical protein
VEGDGKGYDRSSRIQHRVVVLVLKHAVLITNLILLESVEPESPKEKGVERRRSVWEAHFG